MIDTLLATLEREADAEVTRVLDDARTRAAELTRAAERRIAERREMTLGRRETESRAKHERALAAARLQARAQVLDARAELLERLFRQLHGSLPALAQSAAYRGRLAAQLRRMSVFAGERPVTVQCMPALTAVLRRSIKTNGHVRIRSDERITAGFRMTTADGALEIDATLENRLERLRPRLALEALAALSA
jgi:vacuolar-type H+-ATPase subunit E/Vma4